MVEETKSLSGMQERAARCDNGAQLIAAILCTCTR